MTTVDTRTATVVTTPDGHIVKTPTPAAAAAASEAMSIVGAASIDFGWSPEPGVWGEELFHVDTDPAAVLEALGWTITRTEANVGICGLSTTVTDQDVADFNRDYDRHARKGTP